MRPTTLTALAACALMLVGCSATQPAQEPAETPSASAVSVEPRPTSIDEITLDMDPALKEEAAFIHVAQMRATSHGLPEFDPDELVEALHDFCNSGESIKLTDDDYVNDSLDEIASMGTCEKIQ